MRRAREVVRSSAAVEQASATMAACRLMLVGLVAIGFTGLVSVCSGQEYTLGDRCGLANGGFGTCKRARHCPSAQQAGARPEICYYDRNVPIVCCPPNQVATPPTKPPTRPFVATKRPPVNPPPTKPNPAKPGPKGKSWTKCQEYAQEVFREVNLPTLTFFTDVVKESDCAQAAQQLIIGGVKSEPKEFPHMAALGFGDEPNIAWLCGGSLISDRFVMTAAHCLYAKGRGKVKWIQLGDLNMAEHSDNSKPQRLEVLEAIPHPGYKSPSHYNDIALLRLKTAVKFDGFVRPACLPTNASTPVGGAAVATGWGVVEWSNEDLSKDLMKVSLKIHSAQRCNETFKSLITSSSKLVNGFTDNTMICAGDPENKRDTCVGDSGGPLQVTLTEPFCMYSILGLTSFGSRACGETNSPAVYTRVSHYIPWIEGIVWP